MLPKMKYPFTALLLLSLAIELSAQVSKADLQRQNRGIQKEINTLTKRIKTTKNKTHSSLSVIQGLYRKTDLRTRLIHNIHQQLDILQRQGKTQNKKLARLNQGLKRLKLRYAAFIRKSYESRSNATKLLFLLASDDFLQAYKRLNYIKQYAAYRKRQGDKILATKSRITIEIKKIEQQKRETRALLVQRQGERKKLQDETEQQQRLLDALKSKTRTLLATVRRKQEQKRQLDRRIKRLIEREIRLAEARARREREARLRAARTKKTRAVALPLTAEAAKLSTRFSANKAKLPWPVARGKVISKFGRQAYPGLRGIYVENSGVEIATPHDARARAVFSGVVSSIYAVPGGSQAILIQHGAYYTLYNKLDQIFVQKGEHVQAKQQLGHIYTNPRTDKTVLEFQIWKRTQKLNPQAWIYKM